MGDPLRLYGLNALVLNAAGGISEAIARTLLKHGATVFGVDTKNSGVEQHFATVKGITGKAAALLDPDQISAIVEDAVKKLGSIDILINDFPLQPEAPLEEVDEELERLLRSRATLTMAASHAALPHLKTSPQGRIINIGFLRSCFATNGAAASAHAEQDLATMTRALATETGEFAITVNYIQPGAVMTPESREIYRKDNALRDHCIRGSAAHRLGEPIDVAKVALFLASDDAVFVSGTGILVDGGRTNAGTGR
ncbi:MAG: SDR family oxidoreductase [Gammaproteobacteria bacterium]|nr:SDR family oxidoreductase [Gammaproteobacteria bacterium]